MRAEEPIFGVLQLLRLYEFHLYIVLCFIYSLTISRAKLSVQCVDNNNGMCSLVNSRSEVGNFVQMILLFGIYICADAEHTRSMPRCVILALDEKYKIVSFVQCNISLGSSRSAIKFALATTQPRCVLSL